MVSRPIPPEKAGFSGQKKDSKMILLVRAKLKDIYTQGRDFHWIKPDQCPRCGSVRVWGHGYVAAYFDDFFESLLLRRFRCPDCACVIRMKPKGYFRRFQASIHAIRCCLSHRVSSGQWNVSVGKSRRRHWLCALKRNAAAFFGLDHDLLSAFDHLVAMGKIPVSRGI